MATTNINAIVPVPSLSQSGWVVAPSEKADILFSHFYMSDALQSSLYPGKVANIQGLVEKYGSVPSEFCQQLESMLRNYLFGYYPQGVDVQAAAVDLGTDRFDVRLTITVVEAGRQYNFGHLVNVVDSKISGIVRAMNEGG